MTRFLKLVRHQDGKWKALPTETDDLTQVSQKERKYAPIDPAQLLKALDSLLSKEGGIKSIEDVKKIASLMKKFSKKLVSRCVYCNVLLATEPDILANYLEEGGWETINTWLQYAKSSSSDSFLLEMLKLCKLLPMTVDRLKENNTAKLIKSLTKHDNTEVKALSLELVNKWMLIIKGKKASDAQPIEKRRKKLKPKDEGRKSDEDSKSENEKTVTDKHANHKIVKDNHQNDKQSSEKHVEKTDTDLIKSVARLKGVKRTSSDKELKKPAEYYEDVKIDPEPLLPVPKKPRADRPKTAKVYQKNFRSTGLEEATPLPKNISKKTSVIDKNAVAAAKSVLSKFNSTLPDRVTDKKIKPETLLAVNDSLNNKGIKLIPAKPRPALLQESASFMDALCQQPGPPLKKKKKPQPNKANASPTSPTIVPPKLQFYKDTLEMNEDKVEEDSKEEGSPTKEETSENKDSVPNTEESEAMETNEERSQTPPNEEVAETSSPKDVPEINDENMEKPIVNSNQLQSILSHGKRRGKKKSVKWVEENNLKEVFYFDLDETERVNVLRTQNFCDLKSIEVKREREAMEQARRQVGDKMEESTRYWFVPILIDLPPPIVEIGSLSKEKEIERIRQQSTLQEIYFTKEMIPDSPQEPDLEIVPATEPKIIPVDEENVGQLMDYSKREPPLIQTSSLPDVLTSLIMNTSKSITQGLPNYSPEQIPFEPNNLKPSLLDVNIMNSISQMSSSYDPGEPITSNSLLPHPMPSILGMGPPIPESQMMNNMGPPSDWRHEEMNMNQSDPYFRGFPMNPGPPTDPMLNMNMRPRMPEMFRPPPQGMPKSPRGPRPRGRVLCRHFAAGGCRFGAKCTFLHPGINGPPL